VSREEEEEQEEGRLICISILNMCGFSSEREKETEREMEE